ncbi:MAG: NADH:ubiquinone reductase (Na(+)-transporting) subunit C [Candidatus Marinimicrobia bacterium]|nr:NADH:ubiquinone reductase (Na(+)-transporting) subunit C [Candidatus Neomarinimicrobiota bacterium]
MIITIVASILLSSAATLLKPLQERNEALDKKKNILISAGLLNGKALENATPDGIESLYSDNIIEIVIDADGLVKKGMKISDVNPKETPDLLTLYINNKDGKMNGIIMPVSGKGLWSTIYGYLALAPDFNTVAGITFYKHGETPGLGGEIDKPAFTNKFKDKKIFEGNELVGITIAKGKVLEANDHLVDGISGATLTGDGINDFLLLELKKYLPYITQNMEGK